MKSFYFNGDSQHFNWTNPNTANIKEEAERMMSNQPKKSVLFSLANNLLTNVKINLVA